MEIFLTYKRSLSPVYIDNINSKSITTFSDGQLLYSMISFNNQIWGNISVLSPKKNLILQIKLMKGSNKHSISKFISFHSLFKAMHKSLLCFYPNPLL